MQSVINDFRDRSAEVASLLNVIDDIDKGRMELVDMPNRNEALTAAAKTDLLKTLKASLLLMLYNLMESTVANALEAIFDELSSEAVSYDDCSKEIRYIVLCNLKKHNPRTILPDLTVLAQDVIYKTFRKSEMFSGNLDARKIREVASQFGFTSPNKKGDLLLTVKTNRNDLAHGSKSFAEVGRMYPVNEIIEVNDEVVDYLNEMLLHVSEYLSDKRYLSNRSMAS